MGYFVGRARFAEEGRTRLIALSLTVPIALHGIYDWPLLVAGRLSSLGIGPEPWSVAILSIAPIVVVAEWIAAVRLSRRLRVAQLRDLPEGRVVPRWERWSSILLTVSGGVLASLGGLVVLGASWLVLTGRLEGQPVGQTVATGVVAGLTPTLIGVALFLWGVRRLNESGRSA